MRPTHLERERPMLMGQPRLGLSLEGGEHEDANSESALVERFRRRRWDKEYPGRRCHREHHGKSDCE